MATRPDLIEFQSGTLAKAAEVNYNFSELKDYISDVDTEISGYVQSTLQTTITNIYSSIFPVGSIYITTSNSGTCPIASLISGSTWVKVGAGKVLQGADSNHAVNTTIAAGLPNITGYNEGFSILGHIESGNSGAISLARGAYNTADTDGATSTWGSRMNFNASNSSSVYGQSNTVQPPAYVVNFWRRVS